MIGIPTTIDQRIGPETVVWCTESGPRVSIVDRGGSCRVLVCDGRLWLSLLPGHAAQLASGIDQALSRITRDGRRT